MAYIGYFDELVMSVGPQIDAVFECSEFLIHSATFKKVYLSIYLLSLSLALSLSLSLSLSLLSLTLLSLTFSLCLVTVCLCIHVSLYLSIWSLFPFTI